MIRYTLLSLLLIFSGCATRYGSSNNPCKLVSINIVDQNGMSETISNDDRLKEYNKVNFLSNQPYSKVMRVYGRDHFGDTRAYITTYHPNGQPKQYLEVVNNRAQGFYREWFSEGHLKLEVMILGGEADINTAAEKTWLFDGIAHVWDENNFQLAEIAYEKGELHGCSLYYHPNGQMWKRVPYKRNRICGTLEIFLDTGELFQTMKYSDGTLHGLTKRFWSNGNLSAEEHYEKGLLITGHYYEMDGTLITDVKGGTGHRAVFSRVGVCELQSYKNGLLDGEVKAFAEDGHLVRIYHIKNGLKHGEELEYYPYNPFNKTLRPMLSITWREGKIHGISKTWYENGIQESQREMSNNLKTGLSTAWYRDGSLMLIEEYDQDKIVKGDYFKKGEKHSTSDVVIGTGIATLYDADGNFIRRITYHNGLPDEI